MSDDGEEARLLAALGALDSESAEALQFLQNMASALFPGGEPTRDRMTWSDRPSGTLSAPLDEKAHAAQKLAEAEARFRTLVEQIPAVTFMAVLGDGFNEVYVSPHIEAILGYTQKEWLADPFLWYWRLHPADRKLWNEEFTRGVQTGGPFRAECRFLARDGHTVWIHGEARLVKDDLGRPRFLQGVAFDITDSKRAQALILDEAVKGAKIAEEIEIARRVQTSLLPRKLVVPGLDLAATMIPASEVGGDYYDVIPLSDGAWLAIGDVSGHGLAAGLVMLMVQSAMAAATARSDASPREVLRVINGVLTENIRRRMGQGEYVTLSLVRYHGDGRVVFAGAHQDILYCPRSSGRVTALATPGTWLGAADEIAHVTTETELILKEGDLLVLYTDGLTEAARADGELFGVDRLCRLVEQHRALPVAEVRDRVLSEVRQFAAVQDDDQTLMVLRFTSRAS